MDAVQLGELLMALAAIRHLFQHSREFQRQAEQVSISFVEATQALAQTEIKTSSPLVSVMACVTAWVASGRDATMWATQGGAFTTSPEGRHQNNEVIIAAVRTAIDGYMHGADLGEGVNASLHNQVGNLHDPRLVAGSDLAIMVGNVLSHTSRLAPGVMKWSTGLVTWAFEPPITEHLDDEGRYHNPSGPAAEWIDGFQVYAVHGIILDAKYLHHPETITLLAIEGERNQEVRRVLMDLYGVERWLQETDCRLLDSNPLYGKLYQTARAAMRRDENGPQFLLVENSTQEPDGTRKKYMLAVPPDVTSAKEAVAWTFDVDDQRYSPVAET